MSKNPFLDRVASKNGHGKQYEQRKVKSGYRLTPNSGAMVGAKGDAVLGDYLVEMKTTTSVSLSLKRGWLEKISKEALEVGKVPALQFAFVDGEGKPVMRRNSEWVAIPLEVFKGLK